MIDKYLRRFCAQEVQILIAKLEEDYGEFVGYHSTWMRLLEQQRYLTGLEKFCVNKAKRRASRGHERQQYLAAILRQQLNPVTVEQMEDSGLISKAYQQRQMAAYQQAMMKSNMANQMMNAAAQQPNPYQQGLYK